MTREEAVAYLRPIMESATLPRYQEALRLAVEALEARAGGTPDGCEYCRDYWLPWAYCPFCCRPLTEEAWSELERRINDGTAD